MRVYSIPYSEISRHTYQQQHVHLHDLLRAGHDKLLHGAGQQLARTRTVYCAYR
jgi:hypothetical protein